MTGRSSRAILVASVVSLAACGTGLNPPTPVDRTVLPLNVQVRNSGLPGGYIWLGNPAEPGAGRWHRFGRAEFICVTCPEAFIGSGFGYDIDVFDEACRQLNGLRVDGGNLLVEIDPGPTIRVDHAPPLGDWMPADSTPAPLGSVPCSPP